MGQLENFREQLKQRSVPNGEIIPVGEKKVAGEPKGAPASRKVRKKKEADDERRSVWVRRETLRQVKLLSLWLESEGNDGSKSIGDIISEAVDCLIETKYPKAKAFIKRL